MKKIASLVQQPLFLFETVELSGYLFFVVLALIIFSY